MDGRTKLNWFLSVPFVKMVQQFLSCLVFTISLQCDEPKWAQDNGRICARWYKRLHLQGRECLSSLFVHVLVPVQFVESVNLVWCSLSGLILAFFPHGGEPLEWILPPTTP
jgi:hypothetical protein